MPISDNVDRPTVGGRVEENALIEELAARALEDEVFRRSPVSSRLLTYLIERTIRGEAIKAYAVAVDGLGRADGAVNDVENYARVAVARLRKTLASYAEARPGDVQLYIDPGSYTVRVRRCSADPAKQQEQAGASSGYNGTHRGWQRNAVVLGTIAAVAIGLLAIVLFAANRRDEEAAARWRTPDFPTIAVAFDPGPAASAQAEAERDVCRQDVNMALGSYLGMRLLDSTAKNPRFEVRLFASPPGKQHHEVSLVDRSSGRILWSEEYEGGGRCVSGDEAIETAFAIASPGGVLQSYLRRRSDTSDTPKTPAECWMRFTRDVQAYNTIGDRTLAECASQWFAAAPDHPGAALLYAWSLTDKSVTLMRRSARMSALEQAQDVLKTATVLNADSSALEIGQMRTYSFMGQRREALDAARRAIEKANGNRLVVGLAASGMAMMNDPEGERIIRSLHKASTPPLPWEHAALHLAAMMRGDLAEVGRHNAHLQSFETGQPFLLLLTAAYEARVGNRAAADRALAKLRTDPRLAIGGTDIAISRLPIAPEMRARLRQWIATPARPR